MGKVAVSKSAIPARRTNVPNGIFCVECTWGDRLDDPSSVKPMLDLMRCSLRSPPAYVHRYADTRASFEHYIKAWTLQKYRHFPILYLGFHGTSGEIYLGDARRNDSAITLDAIEDILQDRCKGRVIHFSSCETVRANGNRMNSFVRNTGALAVLGYRSTADWLESAVFEALLIAELQGKRLDGRTLPAMLRRIDENYGQLARRLKFKCFTG